MDLGRRRSDLLLALALIACTTTHVPAADPHADADANATQMQFAASSSSPADASVAPTSATPTPAASSTCATEPACPLTRPEYGWNVLLDAAEFGADARLIATDGFNALLELGDGGFRIAEVVKSAADNVGRVSRSSREFPRGAQRPIDVEGDYVLACDETNTGCILWFRDWDMEPDRRQLALPAAFAARGLVFDEPTSRICVYGGGLLCRGDADTEWHEEIAGTDGLQLHTVEIGRELALAVGDHGHWFKRSLNPDTSAQGAWEQQPPLGDAVSAQVSVGGALGVIVGNGRIQTVVGDRATSLACDPPGGGRLAIMLSDSYVGGSGYAISSDGVLWRHSASTLDQPETYCAMQQLVLPEPVLAVVPYVCGLSFTPRLLTARQILGSTDCIICIE